MALNRTAPRWLLLYMLNVSVAVRGVVEVLPCSEDVMCKRKNPENNPEYFKPAIDDLQRCYCDQSCVDYGDCCVDEAPFPYSSNDNITWTCVPKSYNQSVYAVSNCKVGRGWDKWCQKKVYAPNLEYISDLPVFSNFTGLLYANVFCAYCDDRLWLQYGLKLTDYFIKPQLVTQCTHEITQDMLKMEGKYQYGRLIWKVRNGFCTIYQKDIFEHERPCMPSVSSCPIGSDSLLSAKCEAYSQLISYNGTIYRNPYCAICNGVSHPDSCEYKEYTFELHGLVDVFGLDWLIDECQKNIQLRDNLHNGCNSIECDWETGECHVNKCHGKTCPPNEDFMTSRGYVIYFCLSVSIICLLIHVQRSIFISPPKNLPSKNLNSLAWSMLIAQTLFLTSIYSLSVLPKQTTLCYVIGVLIQYFFLASFLWMNVISFDIWFTFSNTFKLFAINYRRYAIYAWGGAGLIVLLAIIVDQTALFPSEFRPHFGPVHKACWLGSYNGLALYFATPIFTILSLNAFFFAMTIVLFRKQQSSVLAISGRKEYSVLLLYIKISTVIGMTWVISLLVMVIIQTPEVHCTLSILNGLQGAFIFIMFDLKPDIFFAYIKVLLYRIFKSKGIGNRQVSNSTIEQI